MKTKKQQGKPIISIMQNLCEVCGKESTTAVQIYPSQSWEYYCKECHVDLKK